MILKPECYHDSSKIVVVNNESNKKQSSTVFENHQKVSSEFLALKFKNIFGLKVYLARTFVKWDFLGDF